jgi:hypothetical protein
MRARSLPAVKRLFAIASALAVSCGDPAVNEPRAWIAIALDDGIDASSVRVEPPPIERRERARTLHVAYERAPEAISVTAEGACPVRAEQPSRVALRAWIAIDEIAQAGYDAPLTIAVRPGCREATAGQITWRQIEGPPLRELETARRGFVLTARTPRFEEVHAREVPRGIVPISAHASARAVLEARWEGSAGTHVRTVRVTAAARSTGLSSVPLGHRVRLAGEWEITSRPEGSSAALEREGSLHAFVPDRAGAWRLREASGEELALQSGRFDEVPLDCGRSECHAREAEAIATSPMTRSWDALSSRGPCALACHTIGEPGLGDGGFAHVARELGHGTAMPDVAAPALRRVANVGCIACHGPAAIPDEQGRWAILRSDVCAVCHDAPPRYGHVAAWRESAMGRSAPTAETQRGECAACHTTDGFLRAIGVRESESRPPEDAAIGIACAACHAPHGPSVAHLVRDLPGSYLGAALPDDTRLCARCHAPAQEGGLGPTSAVLIAGEGAVHPTSCIACHDGGPSELERGRGHTFRAGACAPCHEDRIAQARRESASMHERARAVLVRAGVAIDSAHVAPSELPGTDEARMILGDPAPAAHNPVLARRLLDAAERAGR